MKYSNKIEKTSITISELDLILGDVTNSNQGLLIIKDSEKEFDLLADLQTFEYLRDKIKKVIRKLKDEKK